MPAFLFCSACGAELPSRPPVTCASCGTSHWLNPWPCANGIVIENRGLEVEVTGYLDTWVDVYADDPGEPDAGVINVAYYTAVPTAGARGAVDPAEVSELGWFSVDELPAELAPPGTLEAVLDAARTAGAL